MDPLREGAEIVASTLRRAGYEVYMAGGSVRDLIRGERPKDYDLVTNARPEEVTRLFRRTVQVGAAFGVVRVLIGKGREYEVSPTAPIAAIRTAAGPTRSPIPLPRKRK
jgi:poly(A) polymerase